MCLQELRRAITAHLLCCSSKAESHWPPFPNTVLQGHGSASLAGTPGRAASGGCGFTQSASHFCSPASNTTALSDRYGRPHQRWYVGVGGSRPSKTVLSSRENEAGTFLLCQATSLGRMMPNSPGSRLCPCRLRLHTQLARPNWAKESQAEKPRSFPGELACDRGSVIQPRREASGA